MNDFQEKEESSTFYYYINSTYTFLALLFHIVLIIYCFIIKKFKLKMLLQLTSISFFLTTLYFFFKFGNNLNNCCNHLLKLSLEYGFTMSLAVFILFWSLYLIKPTMLNNNEISVGYAVAFGLHGANFIILFFSFVFFNNVKTKIEYNVIQRMLIICAFSFLYNSFGILVYKYWEIEIYKIYRYNMTIFKFIVFTMLGTVIFLFSNLSYIYFNNMII